VSNSIYRYNSTAVREKKALTIHGILPYLQRLLPFVPLHEFEQQSLLVVQNANLAAQLGEGAIGAGTRTGDGAEIGVVTGTVIAPV
jgi:hypothetical protein